MRSIRILMLIFLFAWPGAPAWSAILSLTTDTIWSGDVRIDGLVVVGAGATLTILPGTQVRVGPAGVNQPNGSSSLVVYGVLVAEGTREKPIVFSSAAAQPAPGDWQGIAIENNPAGKSSLRHCRIEHATIAISAVRANVHVEDCVLRQNGTGFRGAEGTIAVIRASEISGNLKGAEFLKMDQGVVEGCSFIRNDGAAITCHGSSPHIHSNRIEENGGAGIFCFNESSPLIENNLIRGNLWGIQAEKQVAPLIRHNVISDNDIAVRLERMALPSITFNIIHDNRIGILCNRASYPEVRGNNIYDHHEFALALGERQSIVGARARAAASQHRASERSRPLANLEARNKRQVRDLPDLPEEGRIDASENWWGRKETAELMTKGTDADVSFIDDFHDLPEIVIDGKRFPRDRFAYSPWAPVPNADAGLIAPVGPLAVTRQENRPTPP